MMFLFVILGNIISYFTKSFSIFIKLCCCMIIFMFNPYFYICWTKLSLLFYRISIFYFCGPIPMYYSPTIKINRKYLILKESYFSFIYFHLILFLWSLRISHLQLKSIQNIFTIYYIITPIINEEFIFGKLSMVPICFYTLSLIALYFLDYQ